ncbi:MAG: hypothetical protein JW738_04065 [Actinobacteria bacterium]|nr:hypothetical protein [Actinomycetota bacterium]
MHWTTHIITGAALGYVIGKPFPAELAGIAGHIALDMIPHHDLESDLGRFIDTLLGAVVLRTVSKSAVLKKVDPSGACLLGAVGAALPDVELVVKAIREIDPGRFFFPSHNGLLPHGETDNKLIAYFIEATIAVCFLIPAYRKYQVSQFLDRHRSNLNACTDVFWELYGHCHRS